MTISIHVAGVNAVTTRLDAIPENLEREVIRQMSQIVYDNAQQGVRAHDRPRSLGGTGALFQSLYNREVPGGREVGHDPQRAPHALFVHWGTRPHVIKPKNKKALRWAGGGGFVFAKSVKHPGYRGDPWLTQAADVAVREFDTVVRNLISRI